MITLSAFIVQNVVDVSNKTNTFAFHNIWHKSTRAQKGQTSNECYGGKHEITNKLETLPPHDEITRISKLRKGPKFPWGPTSVNKNGKKKWKKKKAVERNTHVHILARALKSISVCAHTYTRGLH
jgi:hypothetical protein